jgi:hypothetical protein
MNAFYDPCRNALRAIIEIGKRDLSNPKYDAFFDDALKALASLPPPPTCYVRDVDGTGSLHACASSEPGAFPVWRLP